MEAVIFIGIQATGKSTFYREQFSSTHVHISLDILKTRARERSRVEDCLHSRQPFVVDNTNVLAAERALYIGLARPAGFTVTGYYFHSSLGDALRRNGQREGKAAVPLRGVVAKYRRLQLPEFEEGFDRLFHVTLLEGGGFLVQDWAVKLN